MFIFIRDLVISYSNLFQLFCGKDIYMNDIGKYAAIDDLFARLKKTIDYEIQYQTSLFQMIGALETIFVAQNNVTK